MVRIKDIAEKAKVSSSTVSRILNFDESLSVSQDTRNHVLEVAQELGYKKHTRKKMKQKQKVRRIGIVQWYSVSEEIEDPYYFMIRLSIERYCYEENISFVKYFKENIEEVGTTALDGLICVGKFSLNQARTFRQCTPNLVFVDSNPDANQYFSVVTDFRKATDEALNYLYQQGHRHIGYIGGKEYLGPERDAYVDCRETSFRDFMTQQETCVFGEENIHIGAFTTADGYRLMKESLTRKNRPTAYLIASDSMAIGALRALHEAKDISLNTVSIISYNDIATAEFTNPPLTTMRVDTDYMGYLAVYMFDQLYQGMLEKSFKIELPTRLIERESVKYLENKDIV